MRALSERFEYHPLSIKGRREANEDSFLAISPAQDMHFLAVADGMGGVAGGRVASSLVLEKVRVYVKESCAAGVPEPAEMKHLVQEVFAQAQETIRVGRQRDPVLSRMGTTLCCVIVVQDKFVVGHIGDSRVYLFRDGGFAQLTDDHTQIRQFEKETGLKAGAAMVKAYGHYLTRSVDGGSWRADIFPPDEEYETLQAGDAFLLCSDGLVIDKGETADGQWGKSLVGTRDLKAAAEKIVLSAYSAGSTDNITVVLATYGALERTSVKCASALPAGR